MKRCLKELKQLKPLSEITMKYLETTIRYSRANGLADGECLWCKYLCYQSSLVCNKTKIRIREGLKQKQKKNSLNVWL